MEMTIKILLPHTSNLYRHEDVDVEDVLAQAMCLSAETVASHRQSELCTSSSVEILHASSHGGRPDAIPVRAFTLINADEADANKLRPKKLRFCRNAE